MHRMKSLTLGMTLGNDLGKAVITTSSIQNHIFSKHVPVRKYR